MEGKNSKPRHEVEIGGPIFTRKSDGGLKSALYFGIGQDRSPEELLELADASIEWAIQVSNARGEQLRVRFEVPLGLQVLRAEVLPELQAKSIEKLFAKREPLVRFAQIGLVERVIMLKASMMRMIQDPRLLTLYKEHGFLPLVRMNFWQKELNGQKRIVITVMPVKGTAMFGKNAALDSPFSD